MTMHRKMRLVILVGIALSASSLAADSLSVVPLANALKNSALSDTKSSTFAPAFEEVTRHLLNQPDEGAELEAMKARLSALAVHRNSRVGKLFFAALAAVPEIENLADSEFAAINVSWPIAFGGSIKLRVEYVKRGEAWLVSALEATADGVAAAPLAGMAPYFGAGAPRPELLDLEAIDYLVGRDPADRQKPEVDRQPFDFDAALPPIFEAETGAFKTLLESLQENIKPGVDRHKRIAALTPHMATAEDVKAMQEADADDDAREAFWATLREQVANALKAPRPAAVPKVEGSTVRVRYRAAGSKDESEQSAQRLRTGKIALGGVR